MRILDAACESDEPVFLLSNRGDAPGIVKAIGLPPGDDPSLRPYEYVLRPATDDPTGWIELAPSTTTPMRFVPIAKGAKAPLPRNRPGESRPMVIEYIDLGGQTHDETSSWPCAVAQ